MPSANKKHNLLARGNALTDTIQDRSPQLVSFQYVPYSVAVVVIMSSMLLANATVEVGMTWEPPAHSL